MVYRMILITVGEADFLKIYTAKNIEADSVELLLNYQELDELTNALMEFKTKVKKFELENQDRESVGFTHLYFKDCGPMGKKSKADIVFYVDLNAE